MPKPTATGRPEAAAVARIADAVVVGSALVELIGQALEANQPAAPKVLASATALAQAVREARRHEASLQA